MTCCGLKIKKKIKSLTLLKGKLLTWFQLLKKTFIYPIRFIQFCIDFVFWIDNKNLYPEEKKEISFNLLF